MRGSRSEEATRRSTSPSPRAASNIPSGRAARTPGRPTRTTKKEPPMTTEPNPADGALALDLDRAHVFHSWSAQGSLSPFTIAGASGTEVWDYDGKHYLDF